MSVPPASVDLVALQRRTVGVLVTGQVLGGIGAGAVLSIGALLAVEVSGSEAWAGAAATASTIGAAIAAVPLARLAQRAGRRIALSAGTLSALAGAALVVAATALGAFPLLLLGYAILGIGTTVGLQARFAATDLAEPQHRGRALSVVVWSTTVGVVIGPNLFAPGEVIGDALGMPVLTGSFVIAVVAQALAGAVYLVGLRPDPYLLSRTLATPPSPDASAEGGVRARRLVVFAIAAVAAAHLVMVSVMAMTPVHLTHHGSSVALIGFTISLHVAGMYGLSPVFGWLSDRVGRLGGLLIGQALLAAALAFVGFGADAPALVTVGLVLLGLGWSASTVSGSALVADLVTGSARARIQGRTDLVMSAAGAVGGAAAGPVLALVGYAGLAFWTALIVLAVVIGVVIMRATAPAPVPVGAAPSRG